MDKLLKKASGGFSRRTALVAGSATPLACSLAIGSFSGMPRGYADPVNVPGLDLSGVDPRIRPQNDLFSHINGGWVSRTQIPADKVGISAFSILADTNRERLRHIIDGISATSGDAAKVKSLYNSALDTAALDAKRLANLQPSLKLINSAHTKDELLTAIGRLTREYNFNFPLDFAMKVDEKNVSRYVYYLTSGYIEGETSWDSPHSGLGLSRKHLVDPAYANVRGNYVSYLRSIFSAAGLPAAATLAQQIATVEQDLAQKILHEEQQRDSNKLYHVYSLQSLQQIMPGVALSHYIDGKHIPANNVQRIIVDMPEYYRNFARIWSTKPLDFLKLWVHGLLLRQNTDFLPAAFRDASFDFYARDLRGVVARPPRWQYAVGIVDDYLPDALGRLFVQRYFPSQARDQIHTLINNLKRAYRVSFEHSWLSPATKQAAITKLDAINTDKVGYPSRWQSYDAITIGSDFYTNILNISRWDYDQDLAKFSGPVDKNKWDMSAPTVNAYYEPTANEIVFPAGILQPPFFDYRADPAVNYGAIGAVIGHEISHAFDDQGAQYDGQGNLRNWWTQADKEHFRALTHRLIAQYNAVVPSGLPAQDHLNGTVTAGENAADLNGLTIALRALRAHHNNGNIYGPVSKEQLQIAFYSWARIYRTKIRTRALEQQIISDPHSPGEVRANQVVKNIDDYYTAFNVKPGDKEYIPPAQRVHIW